VSPLDPQTHIASLERELAWANLKIQSLMEELRQFRVKLEEPSDPDTGFVLMLGNGRRIASGWGFADAGLARLIRVAEQA